MCRRHDAAALVCVRTAAPVDRRAGSCWARARPEPERSRGSRWPTVQRRSAEALRLLLGDRSYHDAYPALTKAYSQRPRTASVQAGPPRAARALRLRPRACPAAAGAPVNRRSCAHAGKCCCIVAAAHIVYLCLCRFMSAALLGVMRFIERPTARAGRFMAGSAPTFATLSTRAIMYE